MTLNEFFDEIGALPVTWILTGYNEECIRSLEDLYSPIELLCYTKGGISWKSGRLKKPVLLDLFFQHGQILGLSDPDTHAIFRASDNKIDPIHQQDFEIRQKLIKACKKPTRLSWLEFIERHHFKITPELMAEYEKHQLEQRTSTHSGKKRKGNPSHNS